MPTPHFGPDALSALAHALHAHGAKKALVLTGQSRRFLDLLQAALEDVELVVFDGARAHVPRAAVDAALEQLGAHAPDALISLGGGAATGLGKALRLETEIPFFAMPTTYAGSEMTSIYAVSEDGHKATGRAPRVRPDGVFLLPAVFDLLPRKLEMQSLLNALAHPISVLGTGTLEGAPKTRALESISKLVGAALWLADNPGQPSARADAWRGAAAAAQTLEAGDLGVHHRLVHHLGARFDAPHAALHAALLPHSLRLLADETPELFAEIEAAAGVPDLPGQLFDTLRRVGAKTMLVQLGVPDAPLEFEDQRMQTILRSARYGRRPTTRARLEDWGLPEPVTVDGGPLEEAEVVVLAVCGRHASAESVVARAREAVGHPPRLTVVAPQPAGRAWYERPYHTPPSEHAAPVQAALDTLDAALTRIRAAAPKARVTMFGFSQGACLACEHVAQRGPRIDGLAVFAAARLGPSEDYGPSAAPLAGLPVLIGGARDDQRIRAHDVEATARWFEAAGAKVELLIEPTHAHRISARHRLRSAAYLTGLAPREGQAGFAGAHQTEALQDALPRRGNSPRRVRYGLYAEQVNATGFVAHRSSNRRAWLYRIRPSAQTSAYAPLAHEAFCGPLSDTPVDPNLAGWAPLEVPEAPTDFVDGLATFGVGGDPALRRGFAVHLYAANRSMEDRAFYDADGDLLIVPQLGAITLLTEQGRLHVPPGRIALIPRGLKFSVLLEQGAARGYVAEVYGRHFELPERGPVGANGLTEARHFVCPEAWYEDRLQPGFRIASKLGGRLFEARQDYSPFDVVAWHGDYAPYVYDLLDFSPVSNTRFDHPDPSIYTVLSAPMDELGAHSLDFVFFPPRWDVTEDTFRPPFFHRNATTEFNGIIRMPAVDGALFQAGCFFLTPSMTPHGVLAPAVQRVFQSTEDPPAERMTERSMWFQFETALPITLTRWAQTHASRDEGWATAWGTYRTHFDPAG